MNLTLQIKSLFLSFLFGIFFSFLLNTTYRLLFTKKKIIRYFSNIFFGVFMALVYFFLLKWFNQGILHPYFLFPFTFGFFLFFSPFKKMRKFHFKQRKSDK